MQNSVYKFGFVTLCGAPNAGKSTLLNRFVGEKVAAVSEKPQTTRFNILSVKEYQKTQIVFVDTPGLFKPSNDIGKILRKSSLKALKSTDITVIIVDISLKNQEENLILVHKILQQYSEETSQFFLAFNKIDKVKDKNIVAQSLPFQKFTKIKDFFMISAETGKNTHLLLKNLINDLPEKEWEYPPQSDLKMDLKRWLSEMTMEKIFKNLYKEIPYQIYVETLSLQEDEDGLHIYQNIITSKEGQKHIIIGKHGKMLKCIGTEARLEIARVLHQRIHLYLLVKVKEEWMRRTASLMDAGFLNL